MIQKRARVCIDCGADLWARGAAKRCKPCSSVNYDKVQIEKARASAARKRALREREAG